MNPYIGAIRMEIFTSSKSMVRKIKCVRFHVTENLLFLILVSKIKTRVTTR